jgi:DNA repair exonuclease SbcCD ATPase subunit
MQLPAAARREVIEDILDIKVFSVMNSLLKDDMQKNKDSISAVDSLIELSKERVSSQKKVITILEEGANQEREKTSLEIQELQTEIDTNTSMVEKLSHEVSLSVRELTSNRKSIKKLIDSEKSKISDSKSKLKHTCETISFFKNNDVCVTCSQELELSHKKSMISRLTEDGEQYGNSIRDSMQVLSEFETQLEGLDEIEVNIANKNLQISNLNSEINSANSRIKKLESSLSQIDISKIEEERLKLKEIANSAVDAVNKKQELMGIKHTHELSLLLLKDGGIKSTIIKEYLPVFNRLINKYLSLMDFYVNFEIDETFSEKIRSRNRDEFTYSSFSEGEKQKIDLALLFTFRQMAKLKNSLSTNILLMDEVLDGSLDANGIEYIINILDEIGEDDTNIFVISHNVEFTSSEVFSRVLQFEKKNDFSIMVTAKAKYSG